MCELCQDRTLQKNIGLYGFISAGGENSCQRSRGVEQTLLGGAYSAASKRRGLFPGTFCIWDGTKLALPLEMLYGFGEVVDDVDGLGAHGLAGAALDALRSGPLGGLPRVEALDELVVLGSAL